MDRFRLCSQVGTNPATDNPNSLSLFPENGLIGKLPEPWLPARISVNTNRESTTRNRAAHTLKC